MSTIPLLDPDFILARAHRETGLTALDGPDLETPLRVLCASLQSEARLTTAGVAFWHERLTGILKTRLRTALAFAQHPEILTGKIVAPIIILGLTRTGTTLLQRLLAADTRLLSVAWWESRFPAPLPGDTDGSQRITAARLEIAGMLAAQPDLAAMHPWDATGADEDIMLLDQTLLSGTTEALACVPTYRAWLATQDLRGAYTYLRQLLQFLLWQKQQRGVTGERWLLKTPMHLGYVDLLAELFPDALFVQTHRDPISSVPSYASMVHGLWLGTSPEASPKVAGEHASGYLETLLNRCLAARTARPDLAFVDVDFRQTVSHPLGVVERIYAKAGLPLTAAARAAIVAYSASHPREARPRHDYTLAQFGLEEDDLLERFRAYRERHILPFP